MSTTKLTAPDWLDADAKKEFARIQKELGSNIHAVDLSVLSDYAQAYSDVMKFQVMVDIEGIKLTGLKGGEYLNPTVTLLMNRREGLARLRRDLGFTPTSRKVKATSSSKTLASLLGDKE